MATARKIRRTKASRENRGNGGSEIVAGVASDVVALPGTTGRYLVLMREGAFKTGVKALKDTAGLRVASVVHQTDHNL